MLNLDSEHNIIPTKYHLHDGIVAVTMLAL